LSATDGSWLLLDNSSLLFEPSFELDPLQAAIGLHRVQRTMMTWLGRYVDERLSYALPGHAHYREWRRPQATIVPISVD
jgi:hypothetical protein